MSPSIEKLLLQIAYICLHITAQGKWHAHYHIAAHVRMVDVYIVPASTTYTPGEHPERALSQAVYYQNEPGYEWAKDVDQEARAASQLQALLDDLAPFMAQAGMEAAA